MAGLLQGLLAAVEPELWEIFKGKRESQRHQLYRQKGAGRASLRALVFCGTFTARQQEVVLDCLINAFCGDKKKEKYMKCVLRQRVVRACSLSLLGLCWLTSQGVRVAHRHVFTRGAPLQNCRHSRVTLTPPSLSPYTPPSPPPPSPPSPPPSTPPPGPPRPPRRAWWAALLATSTAVRYVADVLFPETLIRIAMQVATVTYPQAEELLEKTGTAHAQHRYSTSTAGIASTADPG